MLPAANRLRRAADFTDTTRRGVRASRGPVTAVVALPAGPAAAMDPRIGLVVGKRVGGSVLRHRVSRQLRAAAATVLAELPAGCTVVLRAQPGAASAADLADLTREALRSASASALRRHAS